MDSFFLRKKKLLREKTSQKKNNFLSEKFVTWDGMGVVKVALRRFSFGMAIFVTWQKKKIRFAAFGILGVRCFSFGMPFMVWGLHEGIRTFMV
jgi:hypothetical protein